MTELRKKRGGTEKTNCKWTPTGTIIVDDDVLGNHPVKGVKVRARRWFTTGVGITNASGYYYSNKTFRCNRKVNYSVVWEEDGNFDVRSGTHGQAIYNGPKVNTAWNWTVYGGVHKFYAAIFRAAYRYYNEDIQGLRRPDFKIRIGGYDKCGTKNGDFANWRTWMTWPDIRVYRKRSTCDIKTSQSIFSTTAHEIGHATHRKLCKDNGNVWDFLSGDGKVVEGWARCVQWVVTNEFYDENGSTGYDLRSGYQGLNTQLQGDLELMQAGYSPVAIDLIDDYNQRLRRNPSGLSCNSGTLASTSKGRGCRVGTAPTGTFAFLWPNNSGAFYHTPIGSSSCPGPSWYDGANCYFMDIPSSTYGWHYNNSWYLEPLGNEIQRANDWVTGFTPRQIEDALSGQRTLQEWRDEIKSQNQNYTEDYVDQLFDFYINL